MDRFLSSEKVLVAIAALALIALLSLGAPSDPSEGDFASCYTNHPHNLVMCVDLGAGHHDLSQPLRK